MALAVNSSVSVVIPVRNGAKWVQRAIDSALGQTFPPAEIVVVDDHSTDDTVALARACQPPVKVLVASAHGSNPARNLGLLHTTSTWIQFLDADDYLLPDKIEQQLSSLTQRPAPADLIYSPSLMVLGDRQPAAASPVPFRPEDDDPVKAFLCNRGFQTGAVLWRRSAVLAIGGWKEDFPRCQDYEIVCRAFQAGLAMHWCPHAGAAYCLHETSSLSRGQPLLTLQCNVSVLQAFCAWLKSQNRFSAPYTMLASRRFLELLWSAARWDATWAEKNYVTLLALGFVRPRWWGSRIETFLRVFGWRNSIRLRQLVGRRPSLS